MTARLYEFEGAMRTLREIGAMVPCLSASAIRNYLRAGIKTRQGMTAPSNKQRRAVRDILGDWDSN